MKKIVLASTSRYRRELIGRLGIEVETTAPLFDEEEAKLALEGQTPEAIVASLARGKARSLALERPNALIIGSDQAAEIDGRILGKPGSVESTVDQLKLLAGREHRLLTAVAVLSPETGQLEEALDIHTLRMRPLSDRAIEAYARREQPIDCAGGYRVEALGITLFEHLRGDDFTAIIGLPLTRVVTLLERFGVHVLEDGA
jgi:septum formation protein